ncbi:MAG TPA: gamma carbonic anhydrase family protein, partial [Rhodothermales bacterium]|nr:gamma carbonic anhydrase family protein [Rhodothermales bacterium]
MLHPFIGRAPVFDETVWIAPSADVIGDVVFGPECSVWFQAVVRGDVNYVRLGARTNVQDGAVLHVTNRTAPLVIGDDVTIGHGAIVHGCTVRDRVLVGMGAVVMDHAVIGEDTILGARTLVTQGVEIPPRSLVIGAPAKVVRSLTDDEVATVRRFASNYVRYSRIMLGV